MGKSSISSHLDSETHKERLVPNISIMDNKINIIKNSSNDSTSIWISNVSQASEIEVENNEKPSSEQNDNLNQRQPNSLTLNSSHINKYNKKNLDVTTAEIIDAFSQIKKQSCLRCFSELSNCFPIMFFDGEMAKKFKLHKDKLSYVITYGLGPYLQK